MKCARCDNVEDRINGYCSVYCEDMAEVEADNKRLREALEIIASGKRIPRFDDPRPGWCSEQSFFWNWLTDSEVARAALTPKETGE